MGQDSQTRPFMGIPPWLSHKIHALTITRPPPVSPVGAINAEFSFIQHTLPLPDVPAHSDLEGLNLNITVPLSHNGGLDDNARLPVYVFVHGGGFAVGSSWYPHYNPAAIVKLSAQLGTPMIGITIKYVFWNSLTNKVC
jgi:acetyl esterase/lipase